jgi:hypothetical protein
LASGGKQLIDLGARNNLLFFRDLKQGTISFDDAEAKVVGDHGQARACYRGFDPGSITPERVITAWKEGHRVLPCTINRFITLGAALKSRAPTPSIWRPWRRALETCVSTDTARNARS